MKFVAVALLALIAVALAAETDPRHAKVTDKVQRETARFVKRFHARKGLEWDGCAVSAHAHAREGALVACGFLLRHSAPS